MEIQTLFLEYIIDQFCLKRCQKKRYEQGYDILKEFVTKWLGTTAYEIFGYFSLLKYFGFMLWSQSVASGFAVFSCIHYICVVEGIV